MKVLVACEESQAVCKAFRELGHEAYSNDIQECSGGHPEWHLQMDCFEAIKSRKWDLIIAFPPCTHLSAAGAPSWKIKQEDGRQQAAIDFVLKIMESDCDLIAIENPTGKLNTSWRKPDQIINPFQFGDPYKKRTCLWLKGLPKLTDTDLVEPIAHWCSNSTRGGRLKDGTRQKSKLPIRKAWDGAKERSKTFPGIAKAMADQWGK
ncbi:S-adenosyl-L-methionine-dependent methyltransferase [Vibrio phage 1.154.O._10N.222.52.B12]|nr:S-adenosyl-L-methionine-dependent methyltransferase [Vibrio phage 1.154.O._10N.222.52.B12]